jgi:two-component system CheB/CheR fusion protein
MSPVPSEESLRQQLDKVSAALQSERERTRRAEASERRLRTALAAAHMGVWRWNVRTGQDEVDENLYRLLGRPPDGSIRTLPDFLRSVHLNDRPALSRAVDRSVRERLGGKLEFRVVWPGGAVHWLHDRWDVLADERGEAAYLTGVCLDVTEFKELEESAQRQVQALADGERRKDEFLATLGHELRNPLAPIRTAVEALKLINPDAPALQRMLEVIERQALALARLVDDLLDLSRIAQGKFCLWTEPVEVTAILARGVETSLPIIEARRHDLHTTYPDAPLWLEADPVRLVQVVANLLNNAAKYTPEGGRIWLSSAREKGEIVIRVRDTGVGIAGEMLERIFEPFIQADRSLERSEGGLGVGLSLVRRLVELHGGRVEAVSDGPGKGSEFVVRLPAVPAAPRGDHLPPSPELDGQTCRVLIVDDNPDAAESLALVLTCAGHEVRTAYSGPAALGLVGEFRPDAVLLDIGLPGMNGYEVTRRLRLRQEFAHVLFVAVTGYGGEEDRRRSREAGCDFHLTKPVDPRALLDILASRARP